MNARPLESTGGRGATLGSGIAFWAGVLGTVCAVAGCGAGGEDRALEYMPDMARGPAYKAFAPNPATRDGLTLQRPVAGTIARGYRLFHYGAGDDGGGARRTRAQQPVHRQRPDPRRGAGRSTRPTASSATAPQGKGDGPLAGKIPPPPAYTSERVSAFPPGRIFHVITMGSGQDAVVRHAARRPTSAGRSSPT